METAFSSETAVKFYHTTLLGFRYNRNQTMDISKKILIILKGLLLIDIMVFRVVTPYRLVDGGTSSFKIVP
jgi:hypothetical protein